MCVVFSSVITSFAEKSNAARKLRVKKPVENPKNNKYSFRLPGKRVRSDAPNTLTLYVRRPFWRYSWVSHVPRVNLRTWNSCIHYRCVITVLHGAAGTKRRYSKVFFRSRSPKIGNVDFISFVFIRPTIHSWLWGKKKSDVICTGRERTAECSVGIFVE